MIKGKTLVIYLLLLAVFSLLGWYVIQQGYLLENIAAEVISNTSLVEDLPGNIWHQLVNGYLTNLHHPLAVFIMQLVIIVFVARVCGYIFTKIRQPSVIGEIVAGIVLGPSLVGMYFPEVSAFIFPKPAQGDIDSLEFLKFFSQIGLMLFMFIIGMEVDLKALKNRAFDALIISHTGIVFSFFLGVLLAYFLYNSFAPENVTFTAFALFMGISMSTTAFPVLARIIQERGITKTPLGILAITTAAIDDMTAWCLLAVIIAVVKSGGFVNSLSTIVLTIAYVFVMIKMVQPFMKKFGSVYVSRENLNKTVVAFVFVVLFFSSYVTEVIGIHPLVGAFMAGVIMPHNINFKKIITEKIEDVSLVLLLPLFFVFTGLRTQINLLDNSDLWLIAVVVISVAIGGKFLGATVSSRLLKHSWKESLSMGVIMNSRGLMELIILNIGYDLGIFGKEIFTILVLMALFTTFMTNPMLELIDWAFARFGKEKTETVPENAYLDILISFGPSKTGSALIRLANFITAGKRPKKITAMHLTPSLEINPHDALLFEKEAFGPVRITGHELGLAFETKYKAVDDVEKEIIQTAKQGQYELLLVGSAKSAFTEKITGGKIKHIIESVDCTVGVLVDNNFRTAEHVLFLLSGEEDEYLSDYALKFIEPEKVKITTLNVNENHPLDKAFLEQFQLIVLDIKYWKKAAETRSAWIAYSPSLLIFSKGKK
jgi:Kef-type K+ transport system membrane component KefB